MYCLKNQQWSLSFYIKAHVYRFDLNPAQTTAQKSGKGYVSGGMQNILVTGMQLGGGQKRLTWLKWRVKKNKTAMHLKLTYPNFLPANIPLGKIILPG
jgi:hypothetical protein